MPKILGAHILACQGLLIATSIGFSTTMVFMSLGRRIKESREALGLKQGELARAIGIAQPSLSLLESGRSASPKGETLTELARVLRVSPRWLLTGRQEMQDETPEILRIWQALGKSKKAALLAAGRALAETEDEPPNPQPQPPERRLHVK
jgi:transcriptional regulator with XRE-family HTH domain